MCKVLIKEVRKVHEPKSGTGDSGAWKLFQFDCEVMVEDAQGSAVRRVKTFDAKIGEALASGTFDPAKPFEAVTEGTEPPYSFMLKAPKSNPGGGRRGLPGKSNRQVALECASRVVSGMGMVSGMGDLSPAEYTLLEADKMLAWLDGGRNPESGGAR